jgi:hypothetical protein
VIHLATNFIPSTVKGSRIRTGIKKLTKIGNQYKDLKVCSETFAVPLLEAKKKPFWAIY